MANFFPRSLNYLPLKVLFCSSFVVIAITLGVTYYFTPKYTKIGYQPSQPVPFSHEIHAKQLGMDCRYCHTQVEVGAHSNVPATQTCMNCHGTGKVKGESPRLKAVYDSWASGEPIQWVRIHKAPDYVYFNHSVHVNRGISCYSCHGQVNEMPVVYHASSMSMSWCLECHRAPQNHLRPIQQVYNLDWHAADEGLDQQVVGLKLKEEWKINPPVTCAGCHR